MVGFCPYPKTLDLAGKGMSVTNTLAYYESPQITAVKSFITLAPGDVQGTVECVGQFQNSDAKKHRSRTIHAGIHVIKLLRP
jgi:hypothetical protein